MSKTFGIYDNYDSLRMPERSLFLAFTLIFNYFAKHETKVTYEGNKLVYTANISEEHVQLTYYFKKEK
jgi:hypothetical protein